MKRELKKEPHLEEEVEKRAWWGRKTKYVGTTISRNTGERERVENARCECKVDRKREKER